MISRAEMSILAIATEIVNEAIKFEVSPRALLSNVIRAVENKEKCARATNPANASEFIEALKGVNNYQPVNCRCTCEGVWGSTSTNIAPEKIIYSGNRTIVMWSDGTKTIVKCGEGQEFDEYMGFIAAYAKKMFNSTSGLKKLIKNISCHDVSKKSKKSDDTEN